MDNPATTRRNIGDFGLGIFGRNMENLQATFKKYEIGGRQYFLDLYDPHKIGLGLLVYTAFCYENKEFQDGSLNTVDIEVSNNKNTVTIAASKALWNELKLDYFKYQQVADVHPWYGRGSMVEL